MDGGAIAHDMEIAFLEVNNSFSTGILDVRVSDVPLLRYGPIEDARTGRHFTGMKIDMPLKDAKSLPESIPRDAPADRIQSLHELVHFCSKSFGVKISPEFTQVHMIQLDTRV